MKLTNLFLYLFIGLSTFTFSSCKDDDDETTSESETTTDNTATKYVIAASSGDNDYLVIGDTLSSDVTYDATASDAVQAAGDRTWTFFGTDVVYGFLYNQSDAGTTASYILDDSETITERNELALDISVQTRGVVGDNVVFAYSDRLKDTTAAQYAYFYVVDPETDASTEYEVATDDLLEDGEAAYFTDIAEYEGNMIAGARSISSSAFASDYYNNTYVVVFNDDFTVKQIIKDSGRTGFVAGQLYSQGETGLEVTDDGDLYVFSSGQTCYADAETTTIPSGVLKINAGEFAFDSDYFFDISAASDGYNLFRTYYMGGTTFVVMMYPGTNSNATFGVSADRFAVVDVAEETFTWVTGFPEASGADDDPFSIGTPFIDSDNSRLVVPVTTSDDDNYIYSIDPSDASSEQLSPVTAESIKAVGKLTVTIDE